MKFESIFYRMRKSPYLAEVSREKIIKHTQSHFEIAHLHLSFSKTKIGRTIEGVIWVGDRNFKAQAEGATFMATVDVLIDKLVRQLEKHHAKTHSRKRPQNSRYSKILRLTPDMEYHPETVPSRRGSKAA